MVPRWLSLVERLPRKQQTAGSKPARGSTYSVPLLFQVFKSPKNQNNMQTEEPIHDYQQHMASFKRSTKLLTNSETLLCFLDHLGALCLSVAIADKYADHLPPLLHTINIDLKTMSKTDMEAIIASITSKQQKDEPNTTRN